MNNLIEKDPDKYFTEIEGDNSLFNLPLSNGRTLLYIACQEGKEDIVKFFLKKKLNPLIKSKTEFNKTENCLEVAVRWNFKNIVEILLGTNLFGVKEIKEILNKRNINRNIVNILKKYLGSINSKNNNNCKCF